MRRHDRFFKYIASSFIHSCFMVLSCCSVISLRFKYIHIYVSEHRNTIFFRAAFQLPVCFFAQDNLLLDMYLAPHVRTLYTQIRNRALIQVIVPVILRGG